jgi:hypothetical protein
MSTMVTPSTSRVVVVIVIRHLLEPFRLHHWQQSTILSSKLHISANRQEGLTAQTS